MSWALPLLLLAGVTAGVIRRVKVYDAFAEGAMDGLRTLLRAAPNICAAVVCIGLFRRCGLLGAASEALSGVFAFFGMPKEIAPLAMLRPLSGGASLSLLQRIFEEFGADSYVSRAAACMMGSTETVFYTMAVYLGGVKSKGSGWVAAVSLVTCFAGGVFAAWVCRFL